MKLFTLATLAAILAAAATADAAPQLRGFIAADQVADAPAQPDQQPGDNGAAPQNQSPSKKLSESKGVIHPPPTGDHSVIAPPPTRKTNKAVIPPPGTPGGDQTVQPK